MNRTFGSLLLRHRKALHLTQHELGLAAAVTAGFISSLEKNKKLPSKALVDKLAHSLGLTEIDWRTFHDAAFSGRPRKNIRGTPTRREETAFLLQEVSDQLSEKLVPLYWSLPIGERTWKNTAEQFNGGTHGFSVTPQTVELAVRRWDEKGHVDHRTWNPEISTPPRDAERERTFLKAFPTLRHCLIARIPSFPHETNPNVWDDKVHRWLGRTACPVFLALLRQNDIVGLGAGRGPYYSVKAAQDRSLIAYPKLNKLVSLTGEWEVREWEENTNSPLMDADNVVATLLSSGLKTLNISLFIKQPLILENRVVPTQLVFDSKKNLPKDLPNLALVGIGSLAGGHRLSSSFGERKFSPSIQAIFDKLFIARDNINKMVQKSMKSDSPVYCCIGDLCNVLFPVMPPKSTKNDGDFKSHWAALLDAIESYNKNLVSAEPDLIGAIAERGAVIAVAGGRNKVFAIRELLARHEKARVSILVTDEYAARCMEEYPESSFWKPWELT